MNAVRMLFVVAAIGAGVNWWNNREADPESAQPSLNGFVSVVMPDGAQTNAVIILAPVNCPSDAAQRADALSAELTRRGIPNVRSASYSANVTDPTNEQEAGLKRAVAVINGPIPAVFLKGRGKANPTAEEVVAEYRSIK